MQDTARGPGQDRLLQDPAGSAEKGSFTPPRQLVKQKILEK
jgi:hypothetical protein